MMGRRAKPKKAKAEATRPPARKSPKNDGARVRDLEKQLAEALKLKTEALEQETATSEILRVISSSPTDAQLVFDTIAANARRLCNASSSAVFTFDGKLIHLAAQEHISPQGAAVVRGAFPMAPGRGSTAARAILTRSIAQITDAREDAEYVLRDATEILEFRSVLAVPMLREGHPIGAVSVGKRVTGPFPDRQIALLQTFADQAVIAIENVRLFNETKEALARQTATSDILRVISSSPTNVQPVFDAIVESAATLCDGVFSSLHTFDGELVHLVAAHNWTPAAFEAARRVWPARPSGTSVTGRAIVERTVIHVPDRPQADREYQLHELADAIGLQSALSVPMLRNGVPVGVIGVSRAKPGPFSDAQIELLKTFADQAVIAIENVRLFRELEQKNRALTQAYAQVSETLEQQIATGDILRVISNSPTDVQPIFDAIVKSASRLCGGEYAIATRYDGELLHLVAQYNPRPGTADETARFFPQIPDRGTSFVARALVDAAVVHVTNVEDEDLDPMVRETYRRVRLRAVIAVPMMHEGRPIGVVGVSRATPGPFSKRQIALLRTFADQAVIAIENARLFKELEVRNKALTESLEQQTATAAILRVISSSPTDMQPVMDAVAESAARICGATDATIRLLEGNTLRLVARFGSIPLGAPDVILCSREYPAGRSVIECRTIHIEDILPLRETEFPPIGTDQRTVLATPLMREGQPIGVILIRRVEVQPFTNKQVALLQTFADQAVIAIENVRLFKELEARNRDLTETLEQQTATAEVLQIISRSPSDLQPVLDTVVKSAARFCGADDATIFQLDETHLRLAAHHGLIPSRLGIVVRVVPGSVVGRSVLERRAVHAPDVQTDLEEFPEASAVARQLGYRTQLSVPLLREGAAIGAIQLRRAEVNPLQREADRAAPDLCRPGGHRDRERAPVERTAGAHAGAHPLGRAAHSSRRCGARGQFLAQSRHCPHHDRRPGGPAVGHGRGHDLRV